MYLPIQGTIIVALQADTGKELWKYDLKNLKDLGPNPSAGGRGISYWSGTARIAPRIVIDTTNGFIVQLDARTGEPIPGPAGMINLATGVTEKFGGGYATNMPPALYKNLAIIAARTGEQGRYGLPGDPRAFDLTTGKEVWRFHIVPQPGDENFGTWGLNGWQDRRGPGVWVPMVVDPVNDLVFVPLGNATDQNYGGSRPGENLYATTLLVLQASTGKRKWHFQFTHHDIYDWDVSAPPTLIEATKDGQKIPAVAQMTKQGLLFMFHRLTGEPLFGVEERPVPRFDAPGDQAWPTQPFPVKPAGVTRDSMTRKEVSKISPEAEKYCTDLFDKSVNQGPYTPYGMVPSLVFPGSEGGGGWGGASSNPALGLVFLNTRHLGVIAQLQPSMSSGVLPSFGKQKVPTNFYVDPQGYPCNAPPWSELVAVSTSTGDIVWRIAARRISGAQGERHSQHRDRGERRRADFHGERTGLHRRDDRLRVPCLRRQDRQGAVAGDAPGRRADDAAHLSGRQRQAVRGDRGRRRRRGVSHSGEAESRTERDRRRLRAQITTARERSDPAKRERVKRA